VLKKLAIAFAVLVLLGLGAVYWVWSQATALPDWYTEPVGADAGDDAALDYDSEGPPAPQWVAQDQEGNLLEDIDPVPLIAEGPSSTPETRPEAQAQTPKAAAKPAAKRSKKRSAKRGQRHVIRGFHRQVRKGKDGKKQKPSKAIKASRAVLENGDLELGLILDLSNFPKEKLKGKARQRYDRAVAGFPGLTNRDVWVGVQDTPITVDGYLQLGPNAEVRVGKLTYSLSSAAKRLAMSPAQLRAELNLELRRLGLVDPDA